MRKIILMTMICTFVLLFSACNGNQQDELLSGENHSTETVLEEGVVEFRGERYRLKEDLTTILVLGLDKFERKEDPIAYTNQLQSDFMALLILDEKDKQFDVLHLNRDTMTEIRRLGIGGGDAGKYTAQLALAHTYGSGGSDSCLNAVKAVSDFLDDVRIDHYVSLTMDAVSTLNDLAGGVTVPILDDMTSIDPAFVQGEEVTLRGEQALLYVRSRMGLDDSSNLRRMERQQQYMEALYAQLQEQNSYDDNFLAKSLLEVSDEFLSDCSIDRLIQLAGVLESCTLDSIYSLKGESEKGEEYMEFYVDEDMKMETIIKLFYNKE